MPASCRARQQPPSFATRSPRLQHAPTRSEHIPTHSPKQTKQEEQRKKQEQRQVSVRHRVCVVRNSKVRGAHSASRSVVCMHSHSHLLAFAQENTRKDSANTTERQDTKGKQAGHVAATSALRTRCHSLPLLRARVACVVAHVCRCFSPVCTDKQCRTRESERTQADTSSTGQKVVEATWRRSASARCVCCAVLLCSPCCFSLFLCCLLVVVRADRVGI